MSVGNWTKVEVVYALYVTNGKPKQALAYLQQSTGRGGTALMAAVTPWHPKDTENLNVSNDSQDSDPGERLQDKIYAKYGEEPARLRLLYYVDE